MKCKTDKLANIKSLNLWGNDLEDISLIRDMPNIEICSLSLNKIYSLKDFATAKKLTELYLRKNLISDLQEVKYLTQCPALKVLWLQDNPIAEHPLYRSYIIKLLPNLVKLDSNAVSQEERAEAVKTPISDMDIVNSAPMHHQQKQVDDAAYHQPVERPKSQNGPSKPAERGKSPAQQMQQVQPQIIQQQQQQQQSNNYRNENILCAVLALLKELDESGLELGNLLRHHLLRVVLEYVAKLFAPESIIAQARQIKYPLPSLTSQFRMNDKEKQESEQKSKVLQPGDLILIKTPSSIYEAFRRLGESQYDHIAVVLDDQLSLHISYPRTKIVPTILFTHKKKQPMIIRPRLSPEKRQEFIETLRKMSMDKQYDYYRVIQILISTSIYEMSKYDDKSTDKIICSHQIFKALQQTMSEVTSLIDQSQDYDYHKLGSFTITDFIKLSQKNPKMFEAFPLYTSFELGLNKAGQNDINFEGITISLSEEKSISKIDTVMQIFGRSKLAELIDKYTFLQAMTEKSIYVAQQVYLLRKQIVLAIVLYKTIDIILTSYREYKTLDVYHKKQRTM